MALGDTQINPLEAQSSALADTATQRIKKTKRKKTLGITTQKSTFEGPTAAAKEAQARIKANAGKADKIRKNASELMAGKVTGIRNQTSELVGSSVGLTLTPLV